MKGLYKNIYNNKSINNTGNAFKCLENTCYLIAEIRNYHPTPQNSNDRDNDLSF